MAMGNRLAPIDKASAVLVGIQVSFLAAKLVGLTDWAWEVVFLPALVPLFLLMALCILYGLLSAILGGWGER